MTFNDRFDTTPLGILVNIYFLCLLPKYTLPVNSSLLRNHGLRNDTEIRNFLHFAKFLFLSVQRSHTLNDTLTNLTETQYKSSRGKSFNLAISIKGPLQRDRGEKFEKKKKNSGEIFDFSTARSFLRKVSFRNDYTFVGNNGTTLTRFSSFKSMKKAWNVYFSRSLQFDFNFVLARCLIN